MSKAKDATEKQLISFNDIFADIINVEVFNGEQVVDPDDLVDCPARSLQYEDGKMRELERDVSKRWNNSVDLVLLNVENQTKAEKEMPLRMIGYDGSSYYGQVNQRRADVKNGTFLSPIYPVVSFVLYFGLTRWNQPKSLERCFQHKLNPRLQPFFHNYGMNLIEVAFLEPEKIAKYRSDFKLVAQYLRETRLGIPYTPATNENLVHVEELIRVLTAITGDPVFEKVGLIVANDAKEGRDMQTSFGKYVEKMVAEGEARGMAEGEAKGRVEGKSTGMDSFGRLMQILLDNGRYDDAKRAARDAAYRDLLFNEFGIS